MATDASTPFQSVLSSLIEKFLQEKHACGYSYRESIRILRHLDSFLVQEGLTTCELPASIARKWLAKKAHEGARTQAQRITVTRQFSRFLLRLGYSAYLPDCTLVARNPSTFVPRMLSDEELQKFFQAVDTLQPTARSPLRHLIMPEVFRLLYGCGFRVTEVLKLRVRDVDLDQGIITVHQGKFRKDRLVPPALSVVNRLRKYAAQFDIAQPMPSSFRDPAEAHSAYARFTQSFVNCCYIVESLTPDEARGHGFTTIVTYLPSTPYDAGTGAVRIWMPNFLSLATYLGYQDLSGTQRYLHLTAELFPEITARADAAFGDVIPRREP
jgi:site-specific recombinase XerD